MKRENELYEEVCEEISRVYFLLCKEMSNESCKERDEKLRDIFSAFTLEEVIGFHEVLELL